MKITRDLQKELVAEKIHIEKKEDAVVSKKRVDALNKKYKRDITAYKRASKVANHLRSKLEKVVRNETSMHFNFYDGDGDDQIGFKTYSCVGNIDHEKHEKIQSLGRRLYLKAQRSESPEIAKLIDIFLKEKV